MKRKGLVLIICLLLIFAFAAFAACNPKGGGGNSGGGSGGGSGTEGGGTEGGGTEGGGTEGGGEAELLSFVVALGENFRLSAKESNAYADDNEVVHDYESYATVVKIGNNYYFKSYDVNYETVGVSNYLEEIYVKCTDADCAHNESGAHYVVYSRGDAAEDFVNATGSTTETSLNTKLLAAKSATGYDIINTWYSETTKQYFNASANSTHAPTGRTVAKYVYSSGGTVMYEFYIDTATKACLKFVDHISSYREGGRVIEAENFTVGGNAWGQNGLPTLPVEETPGPGPGPGPEPELTPLGVPVVEIDDDGVATWAAIANASGYKYKIDNGLETTAPASRSVTLTDGQSVKVMSVGDGTNYSDSAWSTEATYTAPAVSVVWPAANKLSVYGTTLTQPAGSTLAGVREGVDYIAIVISNGTATMFDNLVASLFSEGFKGGISLTTGDVVIKTQAELTDKTGNPYSFTGLNETATTDVYNSAVVEYYTAKTLVGSDEVEAYTLIISFTSVDLSSGGGGDETCGECGAADGNHETWCSHHPDYVCSAFDDASDNTTWAPGADGLCDVCGKVESAHQTNSHEHIDSDGNGYCDDYDCNEYLITVNLPGCFTLVYETSNNYRVTLTRDLGKISYLSEYMGAGGGAEETLYAWSDTDELWKEYYKDEGVWTLTQTTYTNEYEIYNAIDGGLINWYANGKYKNSADTQTAVQTGQTLAGRTCSVYSDEFDCNYYVDDATHLVLKVVDLEGGAPGEVIIEAVSYVESGSLGNGYDV